MDPLAKLEQRVKAAVKEWVDEVPLAQILAVFDQHAPVPAAVPSVPPPQKRRKRAKAHRHLSGEALQAIREKLLNLPADGSRYKFVRNHICKKYGLTSRQVAGARAGLMRHKK